MLPQCRLLYASNTRHNINKAEIFKESSARARLWEILRGWVQLTPKHIQVRLISKKLRMVFGCDSFWSILVYVRLRTMAALPTYRLIFGLYYALKLCMQPGSLYYSILKSEFCGLWCSVPFIYCFLHIVITLPVTTKVYEINRFISLTLKIKQ